MLQTWYFPSISPVVKDKAKIKQSSTEFQKRRGVPRRRVKYTYSQRYLLDPQEIAKLADF
jgi:hypothetical protein